MTFEARPKPLPQRTLIAQEWQHCRHLFCSIAIYLRYSVVFQGILDIQHYLIAFNHSLEKNR